MAIVRKIRRTVLENKSRHTEVECTYAIVTEDGEKYLQVDTYGSRTRQMRGKKSQSIRFSREALEQIRTLIGTEFDA